ncbi:MAG: hypothetical protein RSA08_02675, partial [Clostridia bacterium]
YLRCNTYASATRLKLCTSHSNNLEKVTEAIIQEIKQTCNEYLKEEKYLGCSSTAKSRALLNKNNIKNEILILEKRNKDINARVDKIYDDKCSGIITDDDFSRLYKKSIETRDNIEKRLEELNKSKDKEENCIDINKILKDFITMKEITREMLVSLVDKIEISEDKKIYIYYKINFLNKEKVEKITVLESAV